MVELYGHHYKLAAPGSEHVTVAWRAPQPAARRAGGRRAVFGSRGGWERPNWFAPDGVDAGRPAVVRAAATGSTHVGAEARAVRERRGADRSDLVRQVRDHRARARSAPCSGCRSPTWTSRSASVTYTQLCNERGGIECDLTMTRTAPDAWYVVTGSAFGAHDMGWIRANSPDRRHRSQVRDMTSARAVINLCGPLARDVLQPVCEEDVGNAAFRYATAHGDHDRVGTGAGAAHRLRRRARLGAAHPDRVRGARVRAAAGRRRAVRDRRCRLPGDRHAPDGEGLPLLVDRHHARHCRRGRPASAGGSTSRQGRLLRARRARRAARAPASTRRLCTFTLGGRWRIPSAARRSSSDGEVVGFTTSANFGHTIGKPIAYGFLPIAARRTGRLRDRGLRRRRSAARRHDGALYDPTNARLKA